MSYNPRIEEVSDSDPESDPPELDPSDFAPPPASTSLINPADIPSAAPAQTPDQRRAAHEAQAAAARRARDATKHYQCLYPVYFDARRTRQQGRRVSRALATRDPLARTLIDALQALGFPGSALVFEPGKTHPKDWANPGRVKVLLRDREGRDATGGRVAGKDELLRKVAAWLGEHPTAEEDALRYRFAGLPLPKDGRLPAPAVPKGWKMGSILPLHSPAVSGGGVSEDFFKDMMKEMQAGGGAGGAGANPLAGMAEMLGGMGGMGGLGGLGGGMPDFGAAGGGAGQGQRRIKEKGKKK